jgi:hypothetical protein
MKMMMDDHLSNEKKMGVPDKHCGVSMQMNLYLSGI